MKQIRVTKIILVIETVLVFLLVGALGRIGYPPVTLFFLCVLQLMLDVVVFCAVIKPLKNLGETLDMFAGRNWTDEEFEERTESVPYIRQIREMMDRYAAQKTRENSAQIFDKQTELTALQSQINPHFLYNTLNSIKWMATIQNAPGIAEMTTALARLMKNVSKGTDVRISLREELDLVRDYFLIQQYRYGGSISIEYEITDEALYQCQIHRFTLQPLVENALFHGIEPKGCAGKIVIRAEKAAVTGSRPALVISITDGGVGMSPETIRSVLSGDASPSADFFKQVGINNVDKRIKYSFGPEYGIRIESVVDEYTTMVITLPYMISERI